MQEGCLNLGEVLGFRRGACIYVCFRIRPLWESTVVGVESVVIGLLLFITGHQSITQGALLHLATLGASLIILISNVDLRSACSSISHYP